MIAIQMLCVFKTQLPANTGVNVLLVTKVMVPGVNHLTVDKLISVIPMLVVVRTVKVSMYVDVTKDTEVWELLMLRLFETKIRKFVRICYIYNMSVKLVFIRACVIEVCPLSCAFICHYFMSESSKGSGESYECSLLASALSTKMFMHWSKNIAQQQWQSISSHQFAGGWGGV